MHIAVIGNIGAGKTTLTRMLGDHFNWNVLYEAVEGNPYLADFYEDMPRWAFHLQIFFLNSRYAQAQIIQQQPHQTIIQDRTIYEDSYIFTKNLYESGNMSEKDYQTYQMLFDSMTKSLPAPDLIIYLKADLPKLTRQIALRGREFETKIEDAYLANLNRLYNNFTAGYSHGKLLEIDVNNLDFANNPDDFAQIIALLEKELQICSPSL